MKARKHEASLSAHETERITFSLFCSEVNSSARSVKHWYGITVWRYAYGVVMYNRHYGELREDFESAFSRVSENMSIQRGIKFHVNAQVERGDIARTVIIKEAVRYTDWINIKRILSLL